MFTIDDLKAAQNIVYRQMAPTAQIHWPQLSQRIGAEVIVKHENHAPTGAFKVRGGITFIDWLQREHPEARGIITATRGNHGQSQARAAAAAGLKSKIYVPIGNSPEKNAAMRAYGGEVIEFGADFDEAKAEAIRVAQSEDLFVVPPFHPALIRGVSTYAYELMTAHPDLDAIYVAIGCGSGICGTIAARDALGLDTKVIAVVSENFPTAKLSVEAGHLVPTGAAKSFADGIAVREPVQAAYDIYSKGAERFVTVSDAEIAQAIRVYFSDTHNPAEGAGGAALAGLMQESEAMRGQKVAVILSGGNIDSDWFAQILNGQQPKLPA
ncbi:MAG: hypothetical protein CSA68_06395 [Rhodobacterales bacterium]|nr:MAG: hypothetical protein CSA68_06395 [Rhodobacterales bacterium]